MSDENIGTIADEGAEDAGQSPAEAPAGGSGGAAGGTASGDGAAIQGGVSGTIADEESAEDGEPAGDGESAPLPDYTLEVDEATFPMPKENLDSYTAAAKKLRLSREQAEGMLAWHKAQYVDSQKWAAQDQQRTIAAWQKSILEDRDFGGANYKATIADARYALRAFDQDGEVKKLLKQTGAEHHPAVVKIIAKVGRQMREHQYVNGNGGGTEKPKAPLWKRIYGGK